MRPVRLLTLLCLPLLVSACGFQPLHGSAQQIAAFRDITIDVDGRERIDQVLAEALYDRFGSPSGSRYELLAETRINEANMGVGANDIATRMALVLTVDFSLVETGEENPVLTERVRAEATFDLPSGPYAATSARRDAEERAARDAAERIALRVARYIHQQDQ